MDQKMIQRINELARKAKTEGLSEAEATERDMLRKQYMESFRASFRTQLDSIRFADEDSKQQNEE